MSLDAAVKVRVPEPRLKQLTNGQKPGSAGTVNQAVLDAAEADATAEFRTHGQLTFDPADAQHIAVGVRGVVAFLKSYLGQSDAQDEMVAFRKALEDLRDTGPRGRVEPGTNSAYVMPPDPVGPDGVARPAFGDPAFRELIPRKPVGGSGGAFPSDFE